MAEILNSPQNKTGKCIDPGDYNFELANLNNN